MWFIQFKVMSGGSEKYDWVRSSQTPSEFMKEVEDTRRRYNAAPYSYQDVTYIILFAVKES